MHETTKQPKLTRCALATLMALAAVTGGMQAAQAADQEIPGAGVVAEDPWKVDIIYENDTHYRGKDNTGKTVGLSKFRNTLQLEADKKLSDGWAFHGVFRGTYDGVYDLNKDQFGNTAGSRSAADVQLQSTVNGVYIPAQWGAATNIGNTAVDAVEKILIGAGPGAAGGPGINAFVDGYPAQSGAGLRVLGDSWHNINGGVAFAVPVRPCNVDSRGCRDFGGYGDLNKDELASPEFNKRLDFLREAYMKKTYTLGDGKEMFVKLGKQQVVWGRTDLFRVLDVINPVDYSRNNIYDELQDIRIPMWIAQTEYRMGASENMQDRNLQFIWNFDKFRPNNLGQCGTPNVILDAGCFFRGMANLWDNGGTVANFAHFSTATAGVLNAGGMPVNGNMYMATNFGAHQIGIRNVDLPGWSLANGQFGMKFEGVSKDGLAFSVNALTYRSQLPSLHAFNSAQNPFTGKNPDPTSSLIAFDMVFPRVNLIGGSLDLQSEALGAAFRLEGAFTQGEEFANTARPQLYSSNRVFRGVIGIDRPTFVPFISTSRTTLFSAQMFWQHIFNHEEYKGPLGTYGMPDWKDNFIGTLLIKGFMMNDRLSPQIILARDFQARAFAVAPSVEWSITNDLKLTFGANVKGKSNDSDARWAWADCRDCNPYSPFTAYDQSNPGAGTGNGTGSIGLSGMEPLGRFRAGPIGAAFKENEVYFTMRYKF